LRFGRQCRRLRPDSFDGLWVWRPWSEDPISGSGLSLPSGHTATAFGAAWMLCLLFPRAAPVWMLLAIGCAVTRVINHSHFVSDVFISAMLSYAVARALWHWHITHSPPVEIDSSRPISD
jgi:membrane-associated phospholipid phosphatase